MLVAGLGYRWRRRERKAEGCVCVCTRVCTSSCVKVSRWLLLEEIVQGEGETKEKSNCPFIHLSNQDLLSSCYMPGYYLDPGKSGVNQVKIPCPHGYCLKMEGIRP